MGSSRCISGGTITWSTLFGGRDLGRLGSALARQVMQAELAEWSRGTADDWAAQSYQIAKTEVYAYSSAPSCRLRLCEPAWKFDPVSGVIGV